MLVLEIFPTVYFFQIVSKVRVKSSAFLLMTGKGNKFAPVYLYVFIAILTGKILLFLEFKFKYLFSIKQEFLKI